MNAWFRYFLLRSISQRRGRFLLSAASVMLAVAVVTSLVTISLGVREKIGAELKQYGANMIVTHQEGRAIDGETAAAVRTVVPAIKDASLQLYGTAVLGGLSVEIIGAAPVRTTGYRLQGTAPTGPAELMVGTTLATALRLQTGGQLRFAEHADAFTVTGVFEKGSEEDGAVVMPLAAAQRLLGIDGISALLLNADTARLSEVGSAIRARWPALEVKTLRQVAVAEERILGRIQLLMLLVTAVVLFSAVVALGSTMGANVIERMEEIGLMKAIGATPGDIRRFFLAESALAGIAGSAAGYLAGALAAEAVSRTAFGSFVPLSVPVVPGALMLGVVISLLATYLPVRDAMKVVPAQILRGE